LQVSVSFVAKLNQFCRRKSASLLSFAVLQPKRGVFIAKLNKFELKNLTKKAKEIIVKKKEVGGDDYGEAF
jgi:hypothetical protein